MSYETEPKKLDKIKNNEIINKGNALNILQLHQDIIPEYCLKHIHTINVLSNYDINSNNIAQGSIYNNVSIVYGGPNDSSIAESVFIDSLAINFWGGISI